MRALLAAAIVLTPLAAFAAAKPGKPAASTVPPLDVLVSEDNAVCEHFKFPRPAAPIKWQQMADSSDGLNFRAQFDFENTGKPQEVRRREDQMMAFAGTYYLVAPIGTDVPLDWFRQQADAVKGFQGPPAPMKMYWQDDMNVDAEIVQFNKRTYVRTIPVSEQFNLIMIFEPKDGVLKQVCRYARP